MALHTFPARRVLNVSIVLPSVAVGLDNQKARLQQGSIEGHIGNENDIVKFNTQVFLEQIIRIE